MSVFFSQQARDAVLAHYEVLLQTHAPDAMRLSIPTRYGESFAIVTGREEGPALLLLHGSSMNLTMWLGEIGLYSPHFRVIACDLPGEPGRSVEKQLPFDTQDHALWLEDVLDHLGIKQAALVGASLGGWLCAQFAMAHPQRVSRLALLCPAGIGGQNAGFKDIALSLLAQGEEGIKELFRQINGGPLPRVVEDYQRLIAASFDSRKEPIPSFTDEELQRLSMPGLVLAGEKDILLSSRETVDRVSRLLPHMQARLLPGRGHSLAGMGGEILGFLLEKP